MKLAIISDIHEDSVSLQKALNLISELNCNQIACLGDIVGCNSKIHPYHYNRDPNKCIELVNNNCEIVVAGNHDLFAIRKTPQYKADFDYPKNWYDLQFQKRKKLSKGRIWLYEDHDLPLHLNKKNISFLEKLNEFQIASFHGLKILFSHYSFPDLSGSCTNFVKLHEQIRDHLIFSRANGSAIGFSGHRHVEGVLVGNSNSLQEHSFPDIITLEKDTWIDGPAVCRGKKQNGFIILDTNKLELELISLTSQ